MTIWCSVSDRPRAPVPPVVWNGVFWRILRLSETGVASASCSTIHLRRQTGGMHEIIRSWKWITTACISSYQYSLDLSTRAYESPSPMKQRQDVHWKHSGWNLWSPATITGPVINCTRRIKVDRKIRTAEGDPMLQFESRYLRALLARLAVLLPVVHLTV